MAGAHTLALFTTCMADLAAPRPAAAAREVLTAMGWRVEVPPAQSCCGQPALNSGHRDAAARVMRSWADAFAGYDAVVSVAGSCAAMLHHHAPSLLGEAQADRLPRLWEFSQFVTEYGAGLRLALDATVSYHDSCHMTRMLGERESPRRLLSRIEGLRLVEMTDSDTCCGFGGTFSVKFPEVSTAMADFKLGAFAGTGADYLVSADPGCLMHLAGRGRPSGPGAPVATLHLAELVALALPARREVA